MIYEILIILFIHWIADFLFQTKDMALNKSKSSYWLTMHVWVYSSTWMFAGIILFLPPVKVFMFTVITFICHFITDYFTSRWTSRLKDKESYYGFPSFFSVIGLDQFLHYLQLILSYEYIRSL